MPNQRIIIIKKAFIHEYNIVGAFSFFQKISISEIFLFNTYCLNLGSRLKYIFIKYPL